MSIEGISRARRAHHAHHGHHEPHHHAAQVPDSPAAAGADAPLPGESAPGNHASTPAESAPAASATTAGDMQAKMLSDMIDDRKARAAQATDSATRDHFLAEVKQLETMLKAEQQQSAGSPGTAGNPPSSAAAAPGPSAPTSQAPTTPIIPPVDKTQGSTPAAKAPASTPSGQSPIAAPDGTTKPGRVDAGNAANGFSSAPAQGQLSEAEGQRTAVNVADRLMKDFGLSKEQAAGVAGNLYHESAGMNSNVNEFGSDPNSPTYGAPNKTEFGYGWAQWTGTRKDDFLKFSADNGLDPSSPAANYAMLAHELKTTESGTLAAMKEAQTPEDAATAFRSAFERATNPVDEKRQAAAREIYELMG